MMSLVQKSAPNFTTQAVMPDGTFQDVSLSDYRGRYVLLFFYPLDFTFVCPTEIIAFSNAAERFASRDVQVLSCSVDSAYAHLAWRQLPRKQGGIGQIEFPMLTDMTKTIAADYGVLLESGVSLRGLFLIDRHGKVRHQVVNDLPLGRNVEEALRMVDALTFFETKGEVCPANWQRGEPTINPDPINSRVYFEKANLQTAS
jgi:alkyl hydroperoxide reductase subunit AhpC